MSKIISSSADANVSTSGRSSYAVPNGYSTMKAAAQAQTINVGGGLKITSQRYGTGNAAGGSGQFLFNINLPTTATLTSASVAAWIKLDAATSQPQYVYMADYVTNYTSLYKTERTLYSDTGVHLSTPGAIVQAAWGLNAAGLSALASGSLAVMFETVDAYFGVDQVAGLTTSFTLDSGHNPTATLSYWYSVPQDSATMVLPY